MPQILPSCLAKPEPLLCLLACQVSDDGLSTDGMCQTTCQVCIYVSQAVKWESAQAHTVYHATHLLCVPNHLHIVILTLAMECVRTQAKDLGLC